MSIYICPKQISIENKADTKFEYLYTYKYPEENVPEGGYEAFSKGMKKENLGYNLDVTILGITEETPFFDVNLTDSKSEVVISSTMAEKYGIKVGDASVVGALICILLAKKCMDLMYPAMVCNVACSMNLTFSWQMYGLIYMGILVVYFIINELLVGRLKKVNLAEVLKNRE